MLALGLVMLMACSVGGEPDDGPTPSLAIPAPSSPVSGEAPRADLRNVLVFGDSLSAAYNLPVEQGWVALLDARMRTETPGFRMINAAISGETSAGGASRIDAALAQHRPSVVLIGLGANDGLRGLPLEETRINLERLVRAAEASGAQVLVMGMRLPPNYGKEYTGRFFAMFGEIATNEGTAYLPFLLEPIAFDDSAFQDDRLHPTAAAQPKIADHVWTVLAPMLVPPQ